MRTVILMIRAVRMVKEETIKSSPEGKKMLAPPRNTPSITGITPTHDHLVRKGGSVPGTTQEVPSQEDMSKREVSTRTGSPESQRPVTRTATTGRKGALIGTERPVIKSTTGRGMSKKIN